MNVRQREFQIKYYQYAKSDEEIVIIGKEGKIVGVFESAARIRKRGVCKECGK